MLLSAGHFVLLLAWVLTVLPVVLAALRLLDRRGRDRVFGASILAVYFIIAVVLMIAWEVESFMEVSHAAASLLAVLLVVNLAALAWLRWRYPKDLAYLSATDDRERERVRAAAASSCTWRR